MNNKGQAVVEFVLGFWIFSFGLVALIFLTQACLVKLAALETAQLGTDLQAESDLSPQEIKKILIDQLGWKGLSPKFSWAIDLSPPNGSPSFHFYHLVQTRVKVPLPGWETIGEVVSVQKAHE